MADPVFDKALEAFDHGQEKRYHMFVVSGDALLREVHNVVYILELRGAGKIARRLKAAGLTTRDQLFATDLDFNEDPGRVFVIVQNFLTWLDSCELRYLKEANVLKLVLHELAYGAIEREVAQMPA